MTPHFITPNCRVVQRRTIQKRIPPLSRVSPDKELNLKRDSLLKATLLQSMRIWQDPSLKTIWFHSVAVQSRRARHYSKRRLRWVVVIGSPHNECRDKRYPSASLLAIVRQDTEASSKVDACVWTATNESNQKALLDELLAELTTQHPSSRRLISFQSVTSAHIVFDGSVTACLP
ncbi:hypothetical protein TNCV_316801 [Trichonephila clavipes]|nr:hypothetical protein TNCV_316801 [Trichonephila clavipes]